MPPADVCLSSCKCNLCVCYKTIPKPNTADTTMTRKGAVSHVADAQIACTAAHAYTCRWRRLLVAITTACSCLYFTVRWHTHVYMQCAVCRWERRGVDSLLIFLDGPLVHTTLHHTKIRFSVQGTNSQLYAASHHWPVSQMLPEITVTTCLMLTVTMLQPHALEKISDAAQGAWATKHGHMQGTSGSRLLLRLHLGQWCIP